MGLGFGESVFTLVLMLASILGVARFVHWQVGRIRERQPAAGSSPEEILRHRFAKGEIAEEELREKLQALRDSQAL